MKDERFEELMRDAALTYRRPPEPPLDEMWQAIDASLRHDGDDVDAGSRGTLVGGAMTARPRRRFWRQQWFRVAAALVIGVGLGRVWTSRQSGSAVAGDTARVAAGNDTTHGGPAARSALDEPYDRATTKYLGQTAALLIALPNEVRAGRADAQFISRAGDLLLTTRLLLDSPASSDPAMRNLLEDLELVLAQVVRLRSERGRAELDLINQALEQRDVMPRLQSAVADISADDD